MITATKKKVHVFTSDFLPAPDSPRTAGANRSRQVLTALSNAGHQVTYSMPLSTHMAKRYGDAVLPGLRDEELWNCQHYFEPDIVLNRIAPDIAVYCNIDLFRTMRRFATEIVHIADLYGPINLETFLSLHEDCDAAMQDGDVLELRCRETVEKFRQIDYVVTVSERQKYFWSAYCSLAGFSFQDLNVIVCPVAFDIPPRTRKPSPQLAVVYAGGFYPWQNPEWSLRAVAGILEKYEGATLHIYGGPHAGLPNETDVNAMLKDLQAYRCVKYYGYRSAEEVREALSTAWCALELMDQNIERELAITGRTVEFLSTGTPVIYNNYSTLSRAIEKYEAGWTVSPKDLPALEKVFDALAHGGIELVEQVSLNARRLADEEFSSKTSMAALLELCGGQISKRIKTVSNRHSISGSLSQMGRILAISQDTGPVGELRIKQPLRSLQQQDIISTYTFSDIRLGKLKEDERYYEAIVVQRTVPEFIYRALYNSNIPFLLDVDDNLLARAAYREGGAETGLSVGLQYATVVTAPNPRTIRMLEKYSGHAIDQKAFITPNSLPFSSAVLDRAASPPSQIIWIQSDIAALTTSREAVIRAVEEFSRKYELPIVLVGRNVLDRPQFAHQVVMGEIDLTRNLQLLESSPTSIGVAPLETVADQETLDFVAGKSDLKILLFAGYGHPGVYSAAPSYTDSPLQLHRSLVKNSYSEWTEALEYQYREGWSHISEQTRLVQEARNTDRVARGSWAPAIEAVRLVKPFRGSELYEAFMNSLTVKSAPTITPSSITELHHTISRLQREISDLRTSYSWKITSPLRKVAAPLMKRRGS